MTFRAASMLGLALTAGLTAACGEPEVSSLAYADVRGAAQGQEEGAFRSAFKDIKGLRVAWRGRLVEVRQMHGDEFVEITLLALDLDGLEGGTTDPDVVFPVSASVAERLVPGQEVAFTGLIQDFEWTSRRPLLRLEVKQIE